MVRVMMTIKLSRFLLTLSAAAALFSSSAVFAEDVKQAEYAFPDKFMFRAGAYFVDSSNTQFSVNSTGPLGIGSSIDYQKDLGGDQRDTIPRIDAYYRFNEYHRIDFTAFSLSRLGRRELTEQITIGDEVFTINEVLNSDIEYTLYKLAYGYSFYHSQKVELGFIAGLHVTTYDLKFSDDNGGKSESAGVTAPLPVFGLRMNYAINPKWSALFMVEAFAIDYEDTFSGRLTNFELSTEYRLFEHFALGVGVASLGMDVEVRDDDWRGSVSDRYAGFVAFGTLYF
jgi:hypothetical protein